MSRFFIFVLAHLLVSSIARSGGQEASRVQRCPYEHRNTDQKIYEGEIAENRHVGVSNWLVRIRISGHLKCGGTIIAPRFILTSAHCFFNDAPHHNEKRPSCNYKKDGKFWAILKPQRGGAPTESRRIISVLHHKEFAKLQESYEILQNDMAIAVLERRFSTTFEPGFCLMSAAPSTPKTGDECFAIGVGHTKKRSFRNRELPTHARHRQINVRKCHDINDDITAGVVVLRCTDTTSGLKGDSGGPVLCYRQGESTPYLMGIISTVESRTEDRMIMHNALYKPDTSLESFLEGENGRNQFHNCSVDRVV